MDFIPFYLIFSIVSVSLAPAAAIAIANSKAKDRNIVTAHPLGWVLALVFIVDFSLLIGYFAVTNKPAGYSYALVLIFILPSLWMLVDTVSFRIEYDEHSFTVRNILFRKKTFSYRDIIQIRDTVSEDKLQIHGATIIIGKEKIKLSNDMVGAEDFINLAKDRCATQAPAVLYTATPAAEKVAQEEASVEKLTTWQLHQIVRNPKKTKREYVSVIVLLLGLIAAYYMLTVFPVQFMPAHQAEIDFKSCEMNDGNLWLYDEQGTRYTIPRYHHATQGTFGVTAYVSTAEKMEVSYITGLISDPVITDIKLANGQVLLKRNDVLKQSFSESTRVLIPGCLVLLIWICRLVYILILSRDPENATEEELKKHFHRDITDYVDNKDDR